VTPVVLGRIEDLTAGALALQTRYLADAVPVLYNGVLTATPQTVQSAVNTASSAHSKIDLIEDIGPLVGLILGVALIAFGIALITGRRDTEEFAYESDEPVGSTT
jgi:hypothetical protein